jgi:hypothetical protein
MSREITIDPGQRALVFRRRFSSLPQTIQFNATPAGGIVERIGSRWILGRTRSVMPLQVHHELRKGYWDTFFEIYVTPDQAVRVTVARPRLERRLLIGALATFVIAVAAAMAIRFG